MKLNGLCKILGSQPHNNQLLITRHLKFIRIWFKDSIHTSQKTLYVSNVWTNALTLFKKRAFLHCEEHKKYLNIVWENADILLLGIGVTILNVLQGIKGLLNWELIEDTSHLLHTFVSITGQR
jgi:hypothetical protein